MIWKDPDGNDYTLVCVSLEEARQAIYFSGAVGVKDWLFWDSDDLEEAATIDYIMVAAYRELGSYEEDVENCFMIHNGDHNCIGYRKACPNPSLIHSTPRKVENSNPKQSSASPKRKSRRVLEI